MKPGVFHLQNSWEIFGQDRLVVLMSSDPQVCANVSLPNMTASIVCQHRMHFTSKL
jgi:hypothetical protein